MNKLNNKGFTLVEILAVVSILALIIIIVATNGFGAFDNTKKKIDEENKKVIIEGAKVLLVEIQNCGSINDSYINNLLLNKGINCDDIVEDTNVVSEIEVPLSELISKKYVEGKGIDEISDPESYIITINFDGNIELP